MEFFSCVMGVERFLTRSGNFHTLFLDNHTNFVGGKTSSNHLLFSYTKYQLELQLIIDIAPWWLLPRSCRQPNCLPRWVRFKYSYSHLRQKWIQINLRPFGQVFCRDTMRYVLCRSHIKHLETASADFAHKFTLSPSGPIPSLSSQQNKIVRKATKVGNVISVLIIYYVQILPM